MSVVRFKKIIFSLFILLIYLKCQNRSEDMSVLRMSKECSIEFVFVLDVKKLGPSLSWLHALQSQEILNRPVFVLDILYRVWTLLNIAENSEQILNSFWTLLNIVENSEQILNIAENSEQILNITENSEHYWTLLKILNRFWTLSFFLNQYILLRFH